MKRLQNIIFYNIIRGIPTGTNEHSCSKEPIFKNVVKFRVRSLWHRDHSKSPTMHLYDFMPVFQNNSIYRIDVDEKVLFMFFKAFREWIYNPVLTNGLLIQVA